MDAAVAEADVKLYKASGELLSELQAKLPLLLRGPTNRTRKWVLARNTSELIQLLDSFQEWPQLLDAILAELLQYLVDAFLVYCVDQHETYHRSSSEASNLEPLPRAVCRLLYVFCKVRGYKVIVRLLNNEPKYIEPLLICFRTWTTPQASYGPDASWEERYIMLIWLSHLMLAPFELATISGFSSGDLQIPDLFRELPLPTVAQVLLDVALKYLCVAGKDREGASLVIVRLSLRKDMQKLDLGPSIANWCVAQLTSNDSIILTDQYRYVGLLTLLFGLTNSSSSSEASSFLGQIWQTCRLLASGSTAAATAARESAPARKLLIKIFRACVMHTIALAEAEDETAIDRLQAMLEDGIQQLLEWLGDTDTPVRQAASKALGMIVLKLDKDLASEVIEAVLGCLNENILLENVRTGQLVAATDSFIVDSSQFKKNVNAVDALKWHGAMLTLGHVLFRRSPPAEQLSAILEALLMGLNFEQRSNVGTSLGVGVRDAACFGIWSLARKYSTKEVESASVRSNVTASLSSDRYSIGTLQLVAIELVLASCLDPSGNLRRGASAALQELIGRHPDVIDQGIPVVQQVDYHAVARRSKAIADVAEAVAGLGEIYHTALMFALLDWRGCRAVDADSRRQAARSVGVLFARANSEIQDPFARHVVTQIANLRANNTGSNANARHGLLAVLSSILLETHNLPQAAAMLNLLSPALSDLDVTFGPLSGRVTADLTAVLESTASLIAMFARACRLNAALQLWEESGTALLSVLDRCTTATEDDLLATTAARANCEIFHILSHQQRKDLLDGWLPQAITRQKSSYTCRGRIASMSTIFPFLDRHSATMQYAIKVANFLAAVINSEIAIETKIHAMDGIASIHKSVQHLSPECQEIFTKVIFQGLADYTVDQRGDIGSLLRLSSIEAVHCIRHTTLDVPTTEKLVKAITRLAAEKLTKVRFAAWKCLELFWNEDTLGFTPTIEFNLQADVSSFNYYRQLIELLDIDWLRKELLTGLVSSIAGGSDDVAQTSSSALISLLNDKSDEAASAELQSIVDTLLQHLRAIVKKEDREVMPVLDTLILILEQFASKTTKHLIDKRQDILTLVDDLQTPIADIPRIQSLIRLLSMLSSIDAFRLDAVDRVSRKLLHKWPKVRHAAIDSIYLLDDSVPLNVDWNLTPTANKSSVVQLRKSLGVVGRTTAKNS